MTIANSLHASAVQTPQRADATTATVEVELPRKLRVADLAPLLGRHLEQRELTELLVTLNRDGALAGKSASAALAKGTRIRIPDPGAPENGGLFDVSTKASDFVRHFGIPAAEALSRPASPSADADTVERPYPRPSELVGATASRPPATAQAPMPPPPSEVAQRGAFLEDFYGNIGPAGSASRAPAPNHTFIDRDHAPPPIPVDRSPPNNGVAARDAVTPERADAPAVDFNIASAYRNVKRELTDGMIRGAERYERFIEKAAELYEIPVELITAVIAQESQFNPNVSSPVGATGLMQLMPGTARDLGLAVNKRVDERRNPEKNVLAGTKYLAGLLERYDNDLVKAVAAYNAGPGAVDKHGGVPPYKETRNYVAKVLGYYQGLADETNSG